MIKFGMDMHFRYGFEKVSGKYSQSMSDNNNWKGGVGTYRNIETSKSCSRCGSHKNLVVHHKDENRENNSKSNLHTLCKKCHQNKHDCSQYLPKGTQLSKLKKEQASSAKRNSKGHFTN